MNICLQGYNSKHATFALEGSASKGVMVSLTGNNTVSAAADGDAFLGMLLSSSIGHGLVQTSGHMTATYTGTAPVVGLQTLTADGKGGVKTAATGRSVMVCSVESDTGHVSFIL